MSEVSNDGAKNSKNKRAEKISDEMVVACSNDDEYYDEYDYGDEYPDEENQDQCGCEDEYAPPFEEEDEEYEDDYCEECAPVKCKVQKCVKKAKVKAVDCHIKVRPKENHSNCCGKCGKSSHKNNDCSSCCVTTQCLAPSRSMIKCGTPGAVTLPLATVAGTTFTIASANVNTCDFNKPCVLLEFATNIVTTAAILTLDIQIFKVCEKQLVPIPVSPIFTFSRLVAVTESDAFTFSACDCDSCNTGCCNYLVVATVAGVATVGVTTLSNATLSVLVEEKSCNC